MNGQPDIAIEVRALRREIEWRRGNTEVKSPADGIVSPRSARVGALTSAGEAAALAVGAGLAVCGCANRKRDSPASHSTAGTTTASPPRKPPSPMRIWNRNLSGALPSAERDLADAANGRATSVAAPLAWP